MADLGVDGLAPVAQRIGLENAAHLDEEGLKRFGDSPQAMALRERLKDFKGIAATALPAGLRAEMRPYQKEGYDFLCHLERVRLGGILADDMGLGKTLQTLAWLAWLKERNPKHPKPSLVICPASVLHNWRREADRFTPHLRVLVLESGAARHNLRRQIPQHDLIVTNYALLRRDLEELQKFAFRAAILDEAQFIKNPGAQVTQSVKQLRSEHRLALTGTPLENRLLDLWSIVDFIQPGYLGSQEQFSETYEPRGENAESQVSPTFHRVRAVRAASSVSASKAVYSTSRTGRLSAPGRGGVPARRRLQLGEHQRHSREVPRAGDQDDAGDQECRNHKKNSRRDVFGVTAGKGHRDCPDRGRGLAETCRHRIGLAECVDHPAHQAGRPDVAEKMHGRQYPVMQLPACWASRLRR